MGAGFKTWWKHIIYKANKRTGIFFFLEKSSQHAFKSYIWYLIVSVADRGLVNQWPLVGRHVPQKKTRECFRSERSQDRQRFVTAAYISIIETDWFLIWFVSLSRANVPFRYCPLFLKNAKLLWDNEKKLAEDSWDQAAIKIE